MVDFVNFKRYNKQTFGKRWDGSVLNIVLVEPEIPQNCGNIARTCAATGSQLHLVKPLGFDISDRAVKRAGLDYWHLVEVSTYENPWGTRQTRRARAARRSRRPPERNTPRRRRTRPPAAPRR